MGGTMTPQEYQARIRMLEDDLEYAREEVRYWKEQLFGRIGELIDPSLRLTPAESWLILALYRRAGTYLSRETLQIVISDRGKRESGIKSVDVLLTRIRKKLASIDVTTETLWAVGVMMPKSSARNLQPFIIDNSNAEHPKL
jgi:DNA-binding response OmpR family regulator